MLEAILFDMDGVLVDSTRAIGLGIDHALRELGRSPLAAGQVRRFIGPPLEQIAEQLLGTDAPDAIARFVALYRQRYSVVCVTETLAADEADAVLAWCADRWPLAVATSKPLAYARPILEALDLARHFRFICGRSLELDGEPKAAVVARALSKLGSRPAHTLMVGDREHDVIGARAHGLKTIGVLHGAGERAELEAAGAAWIAADLRGVQAILETL